MDLFVFVYVYVLVFKASHFCLLKVSKCVFAQEDTEERHAVCHGVPAPGGGESVAGSAPGAFSHAADHIHAAQTSRDQSDHGSGRSAGEETLSLHLTGTSESVMCDGLVMVCV